MEFQYKGQHKRYFKIGFVASDMEPAERGIDASMPVENHAIVGLHYKPWLILEA